MAPISSEPGRANQFLEEISVYRRLRYQLIELESAGAFDEHLVDEILLAEYRLMAAPPVNLTVILTKFELVTEDQPGLNQGWVATLRADIMQLGGMDSSPLGTPLL